VSTKWADGTKFTSSPVALPELLGLVSELLDKRLPSTLNYCLRRLSLLNSSRPSCLFFIIEPYFLILFLISAFRLSPNEGSILFAQYQFDLKVILVKAKFGQMWFSWKQTGQLEYWLKQ
jgi:hypothetical protein